eukprot:scaffold11881_cov52-Phaeocystis_antarctica.AAC.8
MTAREGKNHRVLDVSAHEATDCMVSHLELVAQELRAHAFVEPGIQYFLDIPLSWACARQQQPRRVAFDFEHVHYRLLLLKSNGLDGVLRQARLLSAWLPQNRLLRVVVAVTAV